MLAGCGGEPGPHYTGPPSGWKQQNTGSSANPVYVNPKNAREQYMVSKLTNFNGTLKDLASQVTTSTILSHKGAKFVNSVPFPGCPGEAGLQTFRMPPGPGHGEDLLRVAFTQWNGNGIVASYERPASAPDNKDALTAMAHSVCTSVLGFQKFPAAPTVQPAHGTMAPRAHGATILMGRPPIHSPAPGTTPYR